MKQLLSLAKTLVLVVLITTSLIQISKLWFEGTSSRNFFYSVMPNSAFAPPTALSDIGNLLEPEQLAVYIFEEEVEYSVIGRGAASYDTVNDASKAILIETLQNVNYVGEVTDITELFKSQHIFLKLPIAFERTLIEDNLNLKRNSLEQIEQMKTFIVVPARDSDDKYVSVFVEDYSSKKFYQYNIDRNDDDVELFNDQLIFYLNDLSESASKTSYMSTFKNGIGLYEDNILLPRPTGDIRYHESLFLDKPFVKNNQFDLEALEPYIDHFFDNPDAIDIVESDTEVKYFLPNVGVSYDDRGLIHYTKRLADEANYVDVSVALTVANQFIDNDTNYLPSEYDLGDYVVDGKTIIFYYSMGYNGFPILMTEDIPKMYDMSYPLIVSVSGDEVIEYKRILRGIDEMIPPDKKLESRYENATDMFVDEVGMDVPIIEMYLGYKWDTYEGQLRLHWVIETVNQTYFYKVE